MAHIRYSKEERIRYHSKRYEDYLKKIEKCKSADEVRKNYTDKVQYSVGFLYGVYGRDVNLSSMKPSVRRGYLFGKAASMKKNFDRW